jgi:hypothetical protein
MAVIGTPGEKGHASAGESALSQESRKKGGF